jgi:hypothetical protein
MSHLAKENPPIVLRCRANRVSYNKKRSVHTTGNETNPNILYLSRKSDSVHAVGADVHSPVYGCLD